MTAPRNKITFSVAGEDGTPVPLAAIRPTAAIRQQADLVRSRAWGEYASREGILVEARLKDVVRKQGLWDDEKDQELADIDRRLAENEALLPDETGRVRAAGQKLSDLRRAAVQMRIDRNRRVQLLTDLSRLRANTAEAMAENEQFAHLVTHCVVHADTKKQYFASVDDYKSRANDPDALEAATHVADLVWGLDPDEVKNRPENRFLLKYRMCDPESESLDLIGPDGRPVDKDGNPLTADEKGTSDGPPPETFEVENDWGAEPAPAGEEPPLPPS